VLHQMARVDLYQLGMDSQQAGYHTVVEGLQLGEDPSTPQFDHVRPAKDMGCPNALDDSLAATQKRMTRSADSFSQTSCTVSL
jgi:hypothetical protein